MVCKLTNLDIDRAFQGEGYQRLSDYINSATPIGFICGRGHKHKISWRKWNIGQRCRFCVDTGEKRRFNAEMLQPLIEAEGYTADLTGYENAITHFLCICPEGHRFETTWANWRSGCRCPVCAKRLPLTLEAVKDAFKTEGYTVNVDTVRGNRKKIEFECPNGHTHQMTWKDWRRGVRCAFCSKRPPITIEKVRASFETEGYTLLSTYQNARAPLEFRCPKGHQHTVSWDGWRRGARCGLCFCEGIDSQNFGVLKNRAPITGRINRQLRKCNQTWRSFYTASEIAEIAERVATVYQTLQPSGSLDHIVPCSWFDLRNKQELEACWNEMNLRFIPLIENIKRSNRVTEAEFTQMLYTHRDILSIATRIPSKYKAILEG